MDKAIKSIGCDVVSISRIQKIIETYDRNVLSYLFSDMEYEMCHAYSFPAMWFSICFAGKEAVSKALGTGFGGILCHTIEVFPTQDRVAQINLGGAALQRANEQNHVEWFLEWDKVENHIFVIVDAY